MTDPAHPYHPTVWLVGEPDIGAGTHSSAKRCVSGRAYPEVDREPTVIGDRVFIGAGTIINMGVTIGESSIVGAGSVVTHDVPPFSIVAGVPARVIGQVQLDGADVELVVGADRSPDRRTG